MNSLLKKIGIFAAGACFLFACTPEEIEINEYSAVFVTWSPLTINVNGEVSFADGSRGVKQRLWTFPGKDIADIKGSDNDETSTERIVHAVFLQPGTFGVRLQTEFNDPSVTLDSLITVTVLENVTARLVCDAPLADGKPVVKAGGTVTYRSVSTGNPDSFIWSLEGAAPTEANGETVEVRYDYPGTWDVRLIAYRNKPAGRDTLSIRNYITVLPADAE